MHYPLRLTSGSGPRIARLYQSLLALVSLDAWISLGSQVQLLIGSRGLLPLAPVIESLQGRETEIWLRFPTFFLLGVSDAALNAGIVLGCVLAVATLLGFLPRLALAISAVLYLSYAVACREFTSFQWDNLLIECLVLAVFLPRHRPAPFAHLLSRLLLFKLYFESGVAKAQSQLGDWFDGSAMSYYYETAPLPAWPGWYAHQFPELWHQIESWGALGLEGLGAFLILGPRRARLVALVGFTGFQLINLATASYGFFVLLTLALHVFLLDDRDLDTLSRFRRKFPDLKGWYARMPSVSLPREWQRVATGMAVACGLLWVILSGWPIPTISSLRSRETVSSLNFSSRHKTMSDGGRSTCITSPVPSIGHRDGRHRTNLEWTFCCGSTGSRFVSRHPSMYCGYWIGCVTTRGR